MQADNDSRASGEDVPHTSLFTTVLVAVILGVALIVRMWDINTRWPDDTRGWAGAFYSNVARNYMAFGFVATKGAMVRTVNPRSPAEFEYYLDHPPMLGWLLAGSFEIFGYHEWSNRLVALACSMGSLVALYFIVKRAGGRKAAVGVLALMSVLPMAVFYGAFADVQGPVVFFFCTLVVLAYQRFRERATWLNTGGMLGAFLLGALTDWPAYYLVPILFVHYFLTARRRDWRIFLLPLLAAIAGAGFLLHLNYVLTGAPSFNTDLILGAFLNRAGGTPDTGIGIVAKPLATGDWINAVIFTTWPRFFTAPCLLLSGAWLIVALVKTAMWRLSAADHLFLIFLVLGAVHVLVFRQGAAVHNYWSYYLLPAVALGSVLAVLAIGGLFLRGRETAGAVFTAAAVCALAVLPVVQSIDLAKHNTYEYSDMGVMLAENLRKDEVLLNDFEAHFGMDFYLRNPVRFALVCPANMQIMEGRTDVRHFFFSSLFPPYKGKVFEALIAQHIQRIELGKGYVVNMGGFDYEAVKPSLEPPKVVKAYWDGDIFHLEWTDPQPGKVAHYRIYRREENVPFYGGYSDVAGTELSGPLNGRIRNVVVVVAVGKDGEESGFSEEITIAHN